MKRIVATVSTALLVLCNAHAQKISIFCDHIDAIAAQQNISFAEAAAKVRAIGYNGVDVRVTIPQEKLQVLDDLGFAHAGAIANIDYCKGAQPEEEQLVLDFLAVHHFDNLLIVPGFLGEDADMDQVTSRLAAFAGRTSALGTVACVEDFDNPSSPCFNIERVGKFLAASPKVGHNLDTGNYLVAGEDCMKAIHAFHDRIAHVHLKDRVSGSDFSCPPVGTGCIPEAGIIKFLLWYGYDGWFTVEQFGSRQMLEDATLSYANVKDAIEATQMTPKMTEYYYPEVPVVAPAEVRTGRKPFGAKYLFNGKDLSKWRSVDGSDAGWTLNDDGTMTVNKKAGDILTRQEFGSFVLHVEWRVPQGIHGSNQARGNSGVYIHDYYEVQILDSYQNKTYVDGMAGALYKQSVPLANPCRQPGEWNVYDITFTAPVLAEDGSFARRPRVTVYFNGVLVQDDYELLGTTEFIGLPRQVSKTRGPILLQSHGDPSEPISFRNIWIKEIKTSK